jgi:teichuronic acid biosynthesis glycosyltransferase TuaG
LDTILIICPTYNSSEYLKQTIDSVCNQTYKNWELIVIDGGSTDSTEQIVKSYEDDKRVCFRTFTDISGPGAARVHAITNSSQNYIAFIDSDDTWYPNKLEKQINIMKNQDLDFTYTDYVKIGEKKKKVFLWPYVTYNDYFRVRSIANSSVMVKRDAVEGCDYLINYRGYAEDTALWLHCLRRTSRATLIPDCLLKYRIHGEARSRNFVVNAKDVIKIYNDYHGKSVMKSVLLYGLCILDVILRNNVIVRIKK